MTGVLLPTIRLFAVMAALAAGAMAASGQASDEPDGPRVLVTGWSGFSMQEGQQTFRFAEDLLLFGVRASLHRRAAARPWVQVDRFTRPDLVCPAGIPCNESGFLVRAGVTIPFTEDDTSPGFHPRFVAGVGAGFSEEIELAYLLGLGGAWTLHPRLAPVFEVRWERVPGLINTLVLGLGLRVGIL